MHLVFHTLSLTVTTVSSKNLISCTNKRICEITVEKRVNRNFPSSYSQRHIINISPLPCFGSFFTPDAIRTRVHLNDLVKWTLRVR